MFNRIWQTFFHTSVFWQWNRKNLSMDLLCRAFFNRMKPVPSWWIWFTQVNVPCRRTSRPHVMFETSTFLHPHHLRITLQWAPLLWEGFYFCLLIILLKWTTLVFISISLQDSTDNDQNRLHCYRRVSGENLIMNMGILDCAVSLTVDSNVCIQGIVVASQVPR